MLKRRKDYDKKAPSKDARKIYIISEGEDTEPNYFSFFKSLTSNLEVITIKPTDGTDPLKLMQRAEKELLSETANYNLDYLNHDKIWFVIDTDTWEKEGKIEPLREYCDKKNNEISEKYNEVKSYSAWNVAQSNPCFEIWLYYHIYTSKPQDYNIDSHIKESFKTYVDKTICGGFKFDIYPVYLEEAIKNSLSNFSYDKEGKLTLYSTEVYKLGEDILEFLKTDLDKLKNKLG